MFFIHCQGQNRGPYALDQIRSMWASGIITADTLYWVQAESVWKPIVELLATRRTETASVPEPAPSAPPRAATDSDRDASSKTFPRPVTTGGPKGVGGWLLFFCISLTILAPIVTFVFMFLGWAVAAVSFHQYPIIRSVLIFENVAKTAL